MNELEQALGDITTLRRQVAAVTQFRGYGPATVAATALLAVLATAVQGWLVKEPASHPRATIAIWAVTALLSLALTGAQMLTRSRRMHSSLSDEMIRMAVEQFLPALGAGCLLTFIFARYLDTSAWMLPGLWQVVFSLGIFSSCRFLPPFTFAAGAWYLLTGLTLLASGPTLSLSPLAMGVPFASGQIFVAIILYRSQRKEAHEL